MAYLIENRPSPKRRDSFVRAGISELLARGSVREVANYPEFCNPIACCCPVVREVSAYFRLVLFKFLCCQTTHQVRRFAMCSSDVS